MEWESVSGRLPKTGQQVFVAKEGRLTRGSATRVVKIYPAKFGTDKKDGEYFFIAPHRYWRHEWPRLGLLYWMPTPPLPNHPSRESVGS